jgi:hypothetical protein
MPRIIVTTDDCNRPDDDPVLLDEQVGLVNLSSDHAAAQLIERIAWAVGDAEGVEQARRLSRERARAERQLEQHHPAPEDHQELGDRGMRRDEGPLMVGNAPHEYEQTA